MARTGSQTPTSLKVLPYKKHKAKPAVKAVPGIRPERLSVAGNADKAYYFRQQTGIVDAYQAWFAGSAPKRQK